MKKLMMATLFISAVAATSTTTLAATRIRVEGSWGNGPSYAAGVYDSGPVYAPAPPPPPPTQYGYARPVSPGRDYVWIDGCYDYDRVGRAYNWRAGYWAHRPSYRAEWVAPRYREGRYHAGYWRR